MLMSPKGIGHEKDYAGDAQQKLKTTDSTSRECAPHQQIRNCLKIIKGKGKIGRGYQMGA
jgi:hypothetical protein